MVGEPDTPRDGDLPLLNLTLPNVISYNPIGSAIILRRKPGLITLYSHKVTLTPIAGLVPWIIRHISISRAIRGIIDLNRNRG